ncbi:HAD family hydrolase [Thermophilibacter provencensis]|uniref:HAD family hydrolase n=1 Tax=Thermophilibacter provencensis TaxID=1852386 RepID=UPI003AA8BD66
MIQAAIFDMDGLMVDTEPIWASAWPPAFARYGLTVAPGLVEACVGSSYERISGLVSQVYDGSPDAQRALDDHYEIGAERFIASGAPKKPGLDELLAWLAGQGIPCAVASSSERRVVEANLRHAGVASCFDAVVTGDDGYPSKPAPDIFLGAAARLGSEPAHTLVLEDSPSGVTAANAGGFITVMVPDLIEPNDELRGRCACVCRDLIEVRDLLASGWEG